MKKGKFLLGLAMLITLIVGTISLGSPPVIDAGQIKETLIWPDQLIAANSGQMHRQFPDYIQPMLPPLSQEPFANINFFFPLDNLKMKEIVGFTSYYNGTSDEGYSVVNLIRCTMGNPGTLLIYSVKSGVTNGITPVEGIIAANDLTVNQDNRYYFHVNVDNNKAAFHGIRLFYR